MSGEDIEAVIRAAVVQWDDLMRGQGIPWEKQREILIARMCAAVERLLAGTR